jgi:hypothetical protein
MVILTHELVAALSAPLGNGRARQECCLDGGGGGRARATQSTSATAVDLGHEPPGPKILLEVDPKVTAASRPSQCDPACRIHRGGTPMHSVARTHRRRLDRDREGEGVFRAC